MQVTQIAATFILDTIVMIVFGIIWRHLGYKAGHEDGYSRKTLEHKSAYDQAFASGHSKGLAEGRDIGLAEGEKRGREIGSKEAMEAVKVDLITLFEDGIKYLKGEALPEPVAAPTLGPKDEDGYAKVQLDPNSFGIKEVTFPMPSGVPYYHPPASGVSFSVSATEEMIRFLDESPKMNVTAAGMSESSRAEFTSTSLSDRERRRIHRRRKSDSPIYRIEDDE